MYRTAPKHTVIAIAASLVACCLPCAAAGRKKAKNTAGPPAHYCDRPAVFAVTQDVVNADLEPFTVTAGAFGNSVFVKQSGGFEPTVYRTRFFAAADGENRIRVKEVALSHWNTWRSGYLDDAAVRVYRVIDGKMHLVREDAVATGGTEISGWRMRPENLIPPETTRHMTKWNDYNRTDVPKYFAVFARDEAGNTSKMSNVVTAIAPPKDKRGKAGVPRTAKQYRFKRKSDDTVPPAAPRNLRGELRDDGVFVLQWDPVPDDGLAGYCVAESDVAPDDHKGHYLDLAGRAENDRQKIRAGDMIIVSTKWYAMDPGLRSNRVGDLWRTTRPFYPDFTPNEFYPGADQKNTWTLRKHEKDTPVADPGETFFEMTLAAGVKKEMGTYALGGKNGDWYHVPHDVPYRVDVWLRADRADAPPVRFRVSGDALPKMNPIEFRPTTRWKRFTAEFPGAPQKKARPTRVFLAFAGPAVYAVDNFRVYRADTPYLDYEPRYYERLARGGMGYFRTHGPIKTGTTTYDMDVFLDAPGLAGGIPKGNTLVQMLRMMKKAKIRPWLQIEFHMSPAEWLAFAEYMAAPYMPGTDTPQSKPWAYRRVRQGRERPWVEEFDHIRFELANETWNWLFSPWVFEGMVDHATGEKLDRGRVYGLMQEHVIGILRSSPYWTEAVDRKVTCVLGGWSGSNYGREAVRGSPSSRYMTIAAYNGGWDEGEGPPQTNPASYFNVLSQVNQTAIPRALKHAREALAWRGESFSAGLGTYEAGPGYALNGLNNARVTKEQAREQEAVMKSKLAGTATLDSFLARAYFGFDTQNFFTFSEGRTWSSHAKWYRGGQAYPCYRWLEIFNTRARGDMLRVAIQSVPTVDTRKFRRRQAVTGAPLAAAYALADGDRVALFCISRKFPGYPKDAGDGYTPFTVALPFTRAKKITLIRLSGAVTDHNIDADRVKVETREIPAAAFKQRFSITPATGGGEQGLPPGEAFLYVFAGTDFKRGTQLDAAEVLEQPVTFTEEKQ